MASAERTPDPPAPPSPRPTTGARRGGLGDESRWWTRRGRRCERHGQIMAAFLLPINHPLPACAMKTRHQHYYATTLYDIRLITHAFWGRSRPRLLQHAARSSNERVATCVSPRAFSRSRRSRCFWRSSSPLRSRRWRKRRRRRSWRRRCSSRPSSTTRTTTCPRTTRRSRTWTRKSRSTTTRKRARRLSTRGCVPSPPPRPHRPARPLPHVSFSARPSVTSAP